MLLGRIPDGGGWRAHGRSEEVRGRGIGYDYVHTAIDDHPRLAHAEIHPDEKGATAAGFLARATAFYAGHGIRIERVLSDNAFAYRNSRVFHDTAADLGIVQKFIRPHCPWTNGKVERLNRTLATEWAYSRILVVERRPRRSRARLAPALQPGMTPPRHRRTHTHGPRQQRSGSAHLGAARGRPPNAWNGTTHVLGEDHPMSADAS